MHVENVAPYTLVSINCLCTRMHACVLNPYLLHAHSIKELDHVAHCMAGCAPCCGAAVQVIEINEKPGFPIQES